MTFEAGAPIYAGYRKENTVNYITKSSSGVSKKIQFSPAPYDIPMTLTIFSNYYEDGLQIVEQILPFFQPEYTVTAKEIPELNLERDIHIVLNSVSFSDNIEGPFEDTRLLEWVLDFTLKGFFYGPLMDKNIITKIDVNTIFIPDFGTQVTQHIEGTPPNGPITEITIEKE